MGTRPGWETSEGQVMSRTIQIGDRTISVPDDATAEDIDAILAEPAPKKKVQLTPEQIAEHANRAAISSARAESPILAQAADFFGGNSGIVRGAIRAINPELADRLFPMQGVDKDSGTYLVGGLLDPTALTIGGGALKVAQAAKTLPVIGSRLAGPVAQSALGGGLGGAAVGALSEDGSAASGGLFGTAVGAALPPVARGAGYIWDRVTNATPALRAKELISKAYGDKLAQARTLWQQASPDVTATQAAAPTGSTVGAALGARAAEAQSQPYADIAAAQAAQRLNAAAQVAGGSTQQAAIAARKDALDTLNKITSPMREQELGAANIGGSVVRRLFPEIEHRQGSMVQALQGQGRAATEAAQSTVRFREGNPGWISNADRAAEWGGTASDFATIKAQRQAEAAFMQRQIDSLAAYGLSPLNTDNIISRITAKLNDPKLAGNDTMSSALSKVGQEIANWTEKGGGVIDAEALYSIRKNVVQSFIDDKLGAASPKQKAKVAAKIMSVIEPEIDDAIVAAGGTGWRDYLRTYSEGRKAIDRMELGAKAMQLLKRSPKQFISLMENNEPKVVQKIFQTDSDVVTAMSTGYWPLRKAASEMQRDIDLASRAAAGRAELNNILRVSSARAIMPRLIDWKFAAAKQVGDIVEGQLNKATMNKVYTALRSGKNAEEIMNMVPAKERIPFLNLLYTGRGSPTTAGLAQMVPGDEQSGEQQ